MPTKCPQLQDTASLSNMQLGGTGYVKEGRAPPAWVTAAPAGLEFPTLSHLGNPPSFAEAGDGPSSQRGEGREPLTLG